MSRKAIPGIMPNDSNRARIGPHSPDGRAQCGARQIGRARPAVRRTRGCADEQQHRAEDRREPGVGALADALEQTLHGRRAVRADSSSIWWKISPRAASSPKTEPATAITISSSGAIENMV